MERIAAMAPKLGDWTGIIVARQTFGPLMRTILIAMAAMFMAGLSRTLQP